MNLDLVKKVIPFVGTALIVCGYIKLSIFYGHFDVKIYYYLEFSEILSLFLSDILLNGSVLLLGTFVAYLTVTLKQAELNRLKHDEIIEEESLWKRIWLVLKLFSTLSIWSLVILVNAIIMFIWFPERLSNYVTGSIIIPAILIFDLLDFEFKRKYKLLNKEKINSSYSNFAFIIFFFLIFTMSSAVREFNQIKKSGDLVEFDYQNRFVKSDRKNLFIGQTRNYLFIKNFKNHEVSIYERRLITNFKSRKYIKL